MSDMPDARRTSFSVVVFHDRHGSYLDECLRRLKLGIGAEDVTVVECAHCADIALTDAKNRAIARTTGEFVLLVSSMDFVEPDCARRLLDYMQSHPDVGAAGALLLAENGFPRRCYMRFPSTLRFLGAFRRWFCALNPRAQRYGALHIEQEAEREVDALPSCCVMIRRKALDQVGPFERDYAFRFDDIDWAWRARRQGWRLCVVPGAKAYHAAPLLHGPVPVGVRLAYEQSLRRFLMRYRSGPCRALFWTGRTIGTMMTGACAGLIALLTAFRSRSSVEHLRGNLAVLRWRLSGSPEVDLPGDEEQTTRWEYAGWRAE